MRSKSTSLSSMVFSLIVSFVYLVLIAADFIVVLHPFWSGRIEMTHIYVGCRHVCVFGQRGDFMSPHVFLTKASAAAPLDIYLLVVLYNPAGLLPSKQV